MDTYTREFLAEELLKALEHAGIEQAEIFEIIHSPDLALGVVRFVYQRSTGVIPALCSGQVMVSESGEYRMHLIPR